MKHILSILLLAVFLHNVHSQDKEPTQHQFTLTGSSPFYISTDSSEFSINRFA